MYYLLYQVSIAQTKSPLIEKWHTSYDLVHIILLYELYPVLTIGFPYPTKKKKKELQAFFFFFFLVLYLSLLLVVGGAGITFDLGFKLSSYRRGFHQHDAI